MSDESKSLDNESDDSCFVSFLRFFFLSRLLLLDFLYFLSSDESDSLYDESDDDGYYSGSSGTCSFPAFSFCFDDFIGRVSGLGMAFLYQHESSPNVIFLRLSCLYQ